MGELAPAQLAISGRADLPEGARGDADLRGHGFGLRSEVSGLVVGVADRAPQRGAGDGQVVLQCGHLLSELAFVGGELVGSRRPGTGCARIARRSGRRGRGARCQAGSPIADGSRGLVLVDGVDVLADVGGVDESGRDAGGACGRGEGDQLPVALHALHLGQHRGVRVVPR